MMRRNLNWGINSLSNKSCDLIIEAGWVVPYNLTAYAGNYAVSFPAIDVAFATSMPRKKILQRKTVHAGCVLLPVWSCPQHNRDFDEWGQSDLP